MTRGRRGSPGDSHGLRDPGLLRARSLEGPGSVALGCMRTHGHGCSSTAPARWPSVSSREAGQSTCPADPKQKGRRRVGLFAGFFWWWGGSQRQTYITQRLGVAANSCGKVRNLAPAACNRISSRRPRHRPNAPYRPPVRFRFQESNVPPSLAAPTKTHHLGVKW